MHVQLHAHNTSIEIFITRLRAHERLMTYESPMQTLTTHACAITHTRHEYINISYVLLCAQKIDDIQIACIELKQS